MTITKEQQTSLEIACRPLIQWLNENCHPHTQINVVADGAELVEGIATVKVLDYLKD